MIAQVKAWAAELGFDDCRIARADEATHAAASASGSPTANTAAWPGWNAPRNAAAIHAQVLPGCQSLICLALNYFPGQSPVSGRPSRRLPHRPLCLE